MVHVRYGRGQVVTSRTHPGLLGLHGTLNCNGEPLVNGHPWTACETDEAIRAAAGERVWLARYEGREQFDVPPVLVATDGAIAMLGVDGRFLRPNIVVAGVEGLAERTWPRQQLRLGGAIIAVASVRQRCVMTTFDPDTQVQDISVLHRIVREFGGRMALDCDVVQPGRISLGDPVELL